MKILFIGNSYTSAISNPLSTILKTIDSNTVVEYLTNGGTTLEKHLSSQNTLNTITSNNWDFVILQDQSQTPGLPDGYSDSFHHSVKELSQLIKANNAIPVLFMTWGYQHGDSLNPHYYPDYPTMQQMLSKAYSDAATQNKVWLAPIGEIWSEVRQMDSSMIDKLYRADGSHPSAEGAFLTACAFAQFFNYDTTTMPWHKILGSHQEEQKICDYALKAAKK